MHTLRSTPMVPAAVAAWLTYVVIDFLTHAVLLSPWWRATESFWLPPMQLAKRIPFAYLSFALYAAGLVWLMARLLGSRPSTAHAARFGALAGLLVGVVQALANYSVFAMPPSALLVWPGSVALASVAAAVSGSSVFNARGPWRRVLLVLLVAVVLLVVGVVVQNLVFPTPTNRLVH